MTTATENLSTVLAHHGIAPLVGISDDARIDAARDHGVLYACLGCASIACAPEGMTTEDYKEANPWLTPDLLDEWAVCCPDETSITF